MINTLEILKAIKRRWLTIIGCIFLFFSAIDALNYRSLADIFRVLGTERLGVFFASVRVLLSLIVIALGEILYRITYKENKQGDKKNEDNNNQNSIQNGGTKNEDENF